MAPVARCRSSPAWKAASIRLIGGHSSRNPKLDLVVIQNNQALGGAPSGEYASQRPACDLLQVWVAGTEPATLRARLNELRVDGAIRRHGSPKSLSLLHTLEAFSIVQEPFGCRMDGFNQGRFGGVRYLQAQLYKPLQNLLGRFEVYPVAQILANRFLASLGFQRKVVEQLMKPFLINRHPSTRHGVNDRQELGFQSETLSQPIAFQGVRPVPGATRPDRSRR